MSENAEPALFHEQVRRFNSISVLRFSLIPANCVWRLVDHRIADSRLMSNEFIQVNGPEAFQNSLELTNRHRSSSRETA